MGVAAIKIVAVLLIAGIVSFGFFFPGKKTDKDGGKMEKEETIHPNFIESAYPRIYLAGGCFWGVEAYFSKIIGIEYTDVGYANGKTEETSYREIGKTDHAETVRVIYDEKVTSLEEILGYYFRVIDPISVNKQGNDRGRQYRTGIYYVDEQDKKTIEHFIEQEQKKYQEPIAVEVEPLKNYVTAEEYHQDYLEKEPFGYCHINLSDIPKEKPEVTQEQYPLPSEEEIQEKLSQSQYAIARNSGTEPPFDNEYWDNHERGLYVDVVTGQPLFRSEDKFESGTGWPSFTKPITSDAVAYKEDRSAGMRRIEVKSRIGNTHLGHVFTDGPKEEGGLRYCMNSGALHFIPFEKLEEEGYEKFRPFFEGPDEM
ncbi:MAG TPA: peptide-methionine (R)-S-oxide reductase [Eubacteriaceae bacterium]|nr:peptide-methionine (R)-S-oxide reductase [Eubacteriaceae bacterium]